MNKNKYEFTLVFIVVIYCCFYKVCTTIYCSSYCSAQTGACTGVSKIDCTTCATSVFNSAPDAANYPSNPCQVLTQTQVIAQQLDINNMILASYTSSNLSSVVCSVYTLSGQYVDIDYISKNFTNINPSHYQLVIRFSVGYIGTWSATDHLKLVINDGLNVNTQTWAYSCTPTQNLCSGTGLDCLNNIQYVITHTTTSVFLNFSALYTGSNPIFQYWGIHDLIIISRLCNAICQSCIGSASNQCTSCVNGYFLSGNTCTNICPFYYMSTTRQCVGSCPATYYLNSLNNYCEPCMTGCSVCISGFSCINWSSDSANPSNLWSDYLGIWIGLICLGGVFLIVISYLLFTYLTKQPVQKLSSKLESEAINRTEQTFFHEQKAINQIQIQDIKHNQAVKVDIKRKRIKRNQIQGFGN